MGVLEFTYFIAKVYAPKRIPSPKVYVNRSTPVLVQGSEGFYHKYRSMTRYTPDSHINVTSAHPFR